MNRYHVYRMRGSFVMDYLGEVRADSLEGAEMVARLMYPVGADERLDIEAA